MDSIQDYTMLKHRIRLKAASFIVLMLSGCELLGPELGIKLPLETEVHETKGDTDSNEIVFPELENSNADKQQDKLVVEEYIGTGQFVAPGTPRPPAKKSGEGKYTLNFDKADLREVAKIILSDMLGVNYVLSPKVGGTVTLQTTRPLSSSELLPTLEMLCRMNGAALLKENGTYRIVPDANALQGGMVPELGRAGKNLPVGYQVRIVPLEFVGAANMAEILTPLMPPKAILRIDHARNLLLIAGTAQELERILDTVNTFDVNIMEGMSFGLFPLDNIDALEAIAELELLVNKQEGGPLAGMFRFLPIERLNAVMVITPQAKYLTEAKKWVARLDRADSVTGEGVIVYRVQHVDATELSETLNSIFSGAGVSVDRKVSLAPGRTPATLSNKKPATKTKQTKINVNKKAPLSTDLSELSDVRVIADEPNNALIIMARPQQYRVVETIIKQLDVMPLQVLIDATIVAVQLNDELEYGVQWLFDNSLPGGYSGVGAGGGSKQGLDLGSVLTDAAIGAFTGGFSYAVLNNSSQVKAVLHMLATQTTLNVMSSPSIMVLNNQEATIQVGDQVPIRTSESTNTSGGGINPIQTSNIEMRDTGVTLTVTPRVNANGIVIMDIDESVDTPFNTETSGIDSPTILQRKINSTVAVVSGETVVLGGLISETHSLNRTGIPFLHDLPWIGDAFGSTVKDKQKDELIVLITPRVIENKLDARKVAREYKKKLTGIYYDLPGGDEAFFTEPEETTTEPELFVQ